MIKELKDYLLMDWWKVADALAIFSGYVPLEDYTSPLTLADCSRTRFIRISDGWTARIDYQEFNRIKKLWLASDYDSLDSDDFRSINSDRLDEDVKKTFALWWAKSKQIESIKDWIDEAVENKLLSEEEIGKNASHRIHASERELNNRLMLIGAMREIILRQCEVPFEPDKSNYTNEALISHIYNIYGCDQVNKGLSRSSLEKIFSQASKALQNR